MFYYEVSNHSKEVILARLMWYFVFQIECARICDYSGLFHLICSAILMLRFISPAFLLLQEESSSRG